MRLSRLLTSSLTALAALSCAAGAASFRAPAGVSLSVGPVVPMAAAEVSLPAFAAWTYQQVPEHVDNPSAALPSAPALPGAVMAALAPGAPQAAMPPSAALQNRDIKTSRFSAAAGEQARALAAAPGAAAARFDNAALPAPDAKDLEKVDPLELEPMQIPVGMREVEQKEKKLRGMSDHDQKKWLAQNAVPYVLRRGKRRPIDHHHETRAAWQAGLDHVYAYSAVDKAEQKRLDAMSDPEFWAEMKRRGWWYDRDQFGEGPRGPELLPEDTRGHADDPFRSLAGEVRKRGGYDKTDVPFAEFAWANFFRKRVKTYPRGDDYEKAVGEAMALAADPAAKDLPGYNGSADVKAGKK